MHGPHPRAAAGKAAADMHEARVVARRDDLRPGVEGAAQLVGEHGHRDVGVLDGEGAAEAAALRGLGQLDQVDAAYRPQQPHRRVAHAQLTQRMAGRVPGHPVGVVRPHVLYAELSGEELGQLVHGRPVLELRPHHPDARCRGRDDRLGALEHPPEPAHEVQALARVARVHVHLAAAGLLLGEVHFAAQPLEQPHRCTPGLGEQGVVEAGYKQGDAQTRQFTRFPT